jgi:hypothetical protein
MGKNLLNLVGGNKLFIAASTKIWPMFTEESVIVRLLRLREML